MIKQIDQQTPFEQHLRKQNLSENTVTSYLWTIKYYTENYEDFSKENLLAYKGWLLEYFKPKTVNLRIQAINKYLAFTGKDKKYRSRYCMAKFHRRKQFRNKRRR